MAGKLYVVATPIGNLGDITLRALEILKTVSIIAAEDTRHTAILLSHFAIKTRLIAIHAHNEKERSHQLIQKLTAGEDIAYVTDAGTPVISDPGAHLIAMAKEKAIEVSPIPGPSAAIAALSASGLPGQKFIFEGFLPTKTGERKKRLNAIQYLAYTLIFYESPHRLLATIEDMIAVMGETRYTVIARELTKKFETIHGDELGKLKTWLLQHENQQKGEFVILLAPNLEQHETAEVKANTILQLLLAELPVKQAVNLTAKITGLHKNKLYAEALTLTGKTNTK